MTGFIVNVFSFRNRVSSKEAFEGLELGEGKPSRPVLRGPGGRKAAWLLGSPIEGDVKRKTLLPELEARTVFAASSPRHDILLFFFSCLTVLIRREAAAE
jgi:hypothetical protein